jgi:hypothetical protein
VSLTVRLRAHPTRRSIRRYVGGLAVLAWSALLTASGCFFSPRPLPGDPEAERPNLNLSGAVPPVSQVINVSHGSTPISFTVPFTSVDGGQGVWWFLWANWGLEGARRERHGEVPHQADLDPAMGGAGATERSIQFSWTPSRDIESGCNQLTLFVTHAQNVNFTNLHPTDFSQAAIATFWVNVDAPLGEGQTLVDCPLPAFGGP